MSIFHRTKKGYTVPWNLASHKGQYYLKESCRLSDDPKGTARVYVEGTKVRIPSDVEIEEVSEVSAGYVPVTVTIDSFLPTERQQRQSQTLDTIAWVDKYNSKLADYLINLHKDELK